jgi:WXG100 family type VII secretion target
MTEIRVNVGDVRAKGQEFQRKRGELEALVSSAKALMSALQGTFTGIRAQRIFTEWEGMQPGLTNAITTLETAGQFLTRAAVDFEAADTAF